jgi:RNA polymerase sigma-70 factor, ECF subfamily
MALPELGEPSERSSARDQARLKGMVADHFDFVWRALRRNGVREGDSDDLAQRVFLTAARRLHDILPGAERAFLLSVAVGEAGHLRRSYRRRAEVGVEALADASTGARRPDEVAGSREDLAVVDAVLEEMPDDLRVIFVLFEIEEVPVQEISQLLEIPVGTAKSRRRRAREEFSARIASLRQKEASKR